MSLKALHLIFVTASTLLAVLFSAWGFQNYFGSETRAARDLVFGVSAALTAVALVVYGRYFLKKLRKVSYL